MYVCMYVHTYIHTYGGLRRAQGGDGSSSPEEPVARFDKRSNDWPRPCRTTASCRATTHKRYNCRQWSPAACIKSTDPSPICPHSRSLANVLFVSIRPKGP